MENPLILGGSGILCQIDESLFRHKPKNHRGELPRVINGFLVLLTAVLHLLKFT
jgi:hypothetical protein